jgi:type II secretory pathway pseudopilin PulG
MPSCTESRRGGFVLLEAIIALAIISLISLALLGASTAQVRTADKGTLLLAARSLAEERMATLRALGYDDLVRLPDSLAAGTFPHPFADYAWRAQVEPVRDEFDLFSVGVAVTVADEEFRLHTLLHEPQVCAPAAPPATGPVQFEPNQAETVQRPQ